MRSIRSSSSRASISPVATIAPAFTIGLNGRLRSSTTMALNGLPDGSTPTRCSTASRPWSSSAIPNTNGFEIGVTHLLDVAVRVHHADAEPVRIGPTELRDVRGDLAFLELPVLVEEAP